MKMLVFPKSLLIHQWKTFLQKTLENASVSEITIDPPMKTFLQNTLQPLAEDFKTYFANKTLHIHSFNLLKLKRSGNKTWL